MSDSDRGGRAPGFRRAAAGDREDYLRLCRDFYRSEAVWKDVPESHFTAAWEELGRSSDYLEAYVFEMEGAVCGYALLAKSYSQEAGGKTLWLDEIYLEERARGRGLASAFIAWLKTGPGGDCVRLRLELEADNLPALQTYAKLGFERLPYRQMIWDRPEAERGGGAGHG